MSGNQECTLPLVGGYVMIVINALLAIIGTFGNVLTILAVLKTPQLRQRPSNFLLLSLAVADVLVTAISQPLLVAILYLQTIPGRCNSLLELLYIIVVSLSGCSSVFHLVSISIDRAISMVKPFEHRDIITKWLKIMLPSCWGIAVIFSIVNSAFPQQGRIAILMIYFTCLLVMAICYGVILYKVKTDNDNTQAIQDNQGARDRTMEKRVTGTVAIVIFLFLACWLPLVAYVLLRKPNALFYAGAVRTLYLANSSMNFVVYSFRIQAFRVAYLRLLRRFRRNCGQIFCCSDSNDATSETRGTELETCETTHGQN